jgi:hypothetical protein
MSDKSYRMLLPTDTSAQRVKPFPLPHEQEPYHHDNDDANTGVDRGEFAMNDLDFHNLDHHHHPGSSERNDGRPNEVDVEVEVEGPNKRQSPREILTMVATSLLEKVNADALFPRSSVKEDASTRAAQNYFSVVDYGYGYGGYSHQASSAALNLNSSTLSPLLSAAVVLLAMLLSVAVVVVVVLLVVSRKHMALELVTLAVIT